jgi:hypothetical protein
MAVGDTITAARFNLIQSRINAILGTGSGQQGYGQALTSSSVSVNTTILASEMNDLYTDMIAARIHQTGAVPTEIAEVVIGDVIAETTSDDPNGSIKGYADYESLMSDIEADKFLIAGTQSTATLPQTGGQSVRSTSWNGNLNHQVVVTFATANNRRFFFNSGGEIRFSANITGGSGAKNTNWTTILANMGTIKMDHTGTSSTGTGTGSAIGNYDLTGTYQTVFTKAGSGVYSENTYVIKAKQNSTSQIQFSIEFNDTDPGDEIAAGPPYPPIDELVNGTLTSNAGEFKATGSYVAVNSGTFTSPVTL